MWTDDVLADFANRCADSGHDVPLSTCYLALLRAVLEERCQPKGRRPVAVGVDDDWCAVICDDGSIWPYGEWRYNEALGCMVVPGSPADTE